jgi:hypothetical protein
MATKLAALAPAEKLEALKLMGFTAFYEDHQPDCAAMFASGIRCNCVPPGTHWSAPKDVNVFLRETWTERRAFAQERNDRWERAGR